MAEEIKHIWLEHKELGEYIRLFSRKIKLAQEEWLDHWTPETLNKLVSNITEAEQLTNAQIKIILKIIRENRKETATIAEVLPELEIEKQNIMTTIEKQESVIVGNINKILLALLRNLKDQLAAFEEDRRDVGREKELEKAGEQERIALRPRLLGLVRDEKRYVAELDSLLNTFAKELEQRHFAESREFPPRFNVEASSLKEDSPWIFYHGLHTSVVYSSLNLDRCFLLFQSLKPEFFVERTARKNNWIGLDKRFGENLFTKQGLVMGLFKGLKSRAIVGTNKAIIQYAASQKW